MASFAVVLVTAGSVEEGAAIGKTLVEERLAACCSVVPGVHSIYRWNGAIVEDAECLLVLKTETRLFDELERRIRALHSYEVPEVLLLPIDAGSEPYLQWLSANLKNDLST